MTEISAVRISSDSSSFAVALGHSFQVYQTDPLRRKHLKDFVNYKITNIAVTGDGTIIAFSVMPLSRDQPMEKVFIWNNQYGEALCQLEFKQHVASIAINVNCLLIILVNSTVVYDVLHRKVLYEVVTAENSHGAGDVVRPDECIIAICGLEPGTVNISEVMAGARPLVIEAHQHPLSLVRFTPDGSMVATASERGTLVRVFDAITGGHLSVFRRGTMQSRVMAMCFSPTNRELIAVSENGTAHLFQADERNSPDSDAPRAIAKLSIAKSSAVDAVFVSNSEFVLISASGHFYRVRCNENAMEIVGRSFILAH
jgi:WD40 repeat protein